MNAWDSGGVRFAIAPSAMSMGSWWRSCSDPGAAAVNGDPPARYSFVILRRARSGDSSNGAADEPGSDERLLRSKSSCVGPGGWELAAGAGQPIKVFFPTKGQTAAAARAICSTGTVQTECLDYAWAESDAMGFGAERRSESDDTTERWRSYACSLARRVLTDAIHR